MGIYLDRLGKAERQQGLNTWISPHRLDELGAVAGALERAAPFARTNPVHAGTEHEVRGLLRQGATVLMLPMFRAPEEVARFVGCVDGGATVVLLLETIEALERVDEIVAVDGVNEVHVGLNDLALALGLPNRFAVLCSPAMERISAASRRRAAVRLRRDRPRGRSGLPIPSDLIYAQYARLGGRAALVSRVFGAEATDLCDEVVRARDRLAWWRGRAAPELERVTAMLRERVQDVAPSRPAVTVCGMMHVPPARVDAILEPLRLLHPEVVLAVDERVDRDYDRGYRQLADRVFRVPYPGLFGRVVGWLVAQCSGRWIVQIDADEIPSAGFAAAIEEVIAAGDATHAHVPWRWLYPDRDRYLAQWPWRPGYAIKAFRNEPPLLRFTTTAHDMIDVLGPAAIWSSRSTTPTSSSPRRRSARPSAPATSARAPGS